LSTDRPPRRPTRPRPPAGRRQPAKPAGRKQSPRKANPAEPPAAAPAARAAELADVFDRRGARSARFQRKASAAGRDIGPIPPIANAGRREAARLDFRAFCQSYLPQTFTLAWSPDHLRVIAAIEAAVLHGRLLAFAMPRGSGKTSLATAAALWALLTGHRSFVVIVGSDELAARRLLESVWTELEVNDDLLADYPEAALPIRALERSTQRCRGQLCGGENTRIEKTSAHFVLPTTAGSPSSGAVLRAVGIGGGLRGLTHKRSDGTTIRPSLVLVDDPATDEVAASPTQVAARLDVMRGAVLGLAGPGSTISGLCTLTVIRPGDLADQLLDRERHPAWHGERASLVYQWPTRDDLWGEYATLRRDGQRCGAGVDAATEFYRQHRAEMDEGAAVGWAERFNPDELSALQHAYNLRIDRGDAAFFSEYQNKPLVPELETPALDQTALRGRVIEVDRGIVPTDHTTLTLGIDVQAFGLFWLVASWGDSFGGNVVAYGSYPDQGQAMFSASGAKRTMADLHPGGFEAVLAAALAQLAGQLLPRDWRREDGATQRIAACVIDANWGNSTATVREFARRHPAAAMIFPAHGVGIGATSAPLNDGRRKAGERIGPGWRIGNIGGQLGVRHDTNFWKTFLAARLTTTIGDAGALTFHRGDHPLLIDHLSAERPVTVSARGRTVEQWMQLPGRENHLLDGLVMAAVGASIAGIVAPGAELVGRRRRKVTLPAPGERRMIQTRPLR
jgi:hypothetical protein